MNRSGWVHSEKLLRVRIFWAWTNPRRRTLCPFAGPRSESPSRTCQLRSLRFLVAVFDYHCSISSFGLCAIVASTSLAYRGLRSDFDPCWLFDCLQLNSWWHSNWRRIHPNSDCCLAFWNAPPQFQKLPALQPSDLFPFSCIVASCRFRFLRLSFGRGPAASFFSWSHQRDHLICWHSTSTNPYHYSFAAFQRWTNQCDHVRHSENSFGCSELSDPPWSSSYFSPILMLFFEFESTAFAGSNLQTMCCFCSNCGSDCWTAVLLRSGVDLFTIAPWSRLHLTCETVLLGSCHSRHSDC